MSKMYINFRKQVSSYIYFFHSLSTFQKISNDTNLVLGKKKMHINQISLFWLIVLFSNLFPETAPSFFPCFSSSSTPAQSPLAKSVAPMYRSVPVLVPLTSTLSPIFRDGFFAVGVDAIPALFRLEEDVDNARDAEIGLGVVGRKLDGKCVVPFAFTDMEPPLSDTQSSGLGVSEDIPGVLESLEMRENTPLFGSHWKYRTPCTDPSFLPSALSNTTPAHSPAANFVSPM